MRILIISPVLLPVPPYRGYGGTERSIYELVKGLAERGHIIYLVASAQSKVKLRNVSLIRFNSKELKSLKFADLDYLQERVIMEQYREFIAKKIKYFNGKIDLINAHIEDETIFKQLKKLQVPLIVTYHNIIPEDKQKKYAEYADAIITQSKSHKKQFTYGNINPILQGIDTDNIPYSNTSLSAYKGKLNLKILKKIRNEKKDYVIILSRIHRTKGQLSAMDIAKAAGLPIVIVGPVLLDEKGGLDNSIYYFRDHIHPYIDNENVYYITNANEKKKYELMMYAKAIIFPSGFEDEKWKEPFGRVVAESLATGTPVIAYKDGGGAAEQIIHNKTGFLFTNFKEAVRQLQKIDTISRKACSKHARTKLDRKRFAKETQAFFEKIVQKTIRQRL